MVENNALLAMIANPQLPKINTPFELAAGVEEIKGQRLNNQIKQKSLEPQDLSDKEKIENAISRVSYVAQRLQGFVGKEYTPELDKQYQGVRSEISRELGMPLDNLPVTYNKDALSNVYAQGVKTGHDMIKRYQFLSTDKGIKVGDTATGMMDNPNIGEIYAPNASPELQGELVQHREAFKGVDVTDPQGRQYRAPQQEANPSFIPKGNNYGNIRPQGASTGFQSFNSPEEGLAAIDQNLVAYGKKGISTLEDIISRWAPPNENDTPRLIADASKRLQIHPSQQLDLNNPAVRQAVSTAIMYQEHGPKGIFGGVVKGPSIAQQEQTKANIDIDKTRQQESIKSAQKIQETKGLSEAKRETSGANINALLNQKFDGEGIEYIIKKSTGSGIGTAIDAMGRLIGSPTNSSLATNKLKTISGWLVSNVPRMEGPQSDYDVKIYQQMAGDIADPTKTREERIAAYNTIKQIVSKYSGATQQPNVTKDGRTTDDLLRLYGGE